jgi:hypothetical protein
VAILQRDWTLAYQIDEPLLLLNLVNDLFELGLVRHIAHNGLDGAIDASLCCFFEGFLSAANDVYRFCSIGV